MKDTLECKCEICTESRNARLKHQKRLRENRKSIRKDLENNPFLKDLRDAYIEPETCQWICQDCANKAELKCKSPVVTQHQGVCGACGKRKGIVNIRDYGWPEIEKGKFANE